MPARKNQSSSGLPELELQSGFEQLQIRYVLVSQAMTWELQGNPKKHDLQKIADSITENGFRDAPAFDAKLNGGKGGLVFGNGRTEALAWMEGQGRSVPRGIALTKDEHWAMPILFGVDARSEAAARRFSLDHNLLTMAGGEYTAVDMGRMFESGPYLDMLQGLAELDQLPLMVDNEDLSLLLELDGKEEPPNFEPVGIEEQGRLDQKKPIVCPHCGEEFLPG